MVWYFNDLLCIISGWSPLIIYFIWNIAEFDSLQPQSSITKALRSESGPYWIVLSYFTQRIGAVLGALYIIWLLGGLIGIYKHAYSKPEYYAILIWPALFYILLMFRSPWGLWPWYGYPLIACIPVGFVVLNDAGAFNIRKAELVFSTMSAAAYLAFSFIIINQIRRPLAAGVMYSDAQALRAFAADHSGNYAEGDRSGVVGYLLGRPLLQLEGLVGGQSVIDAIKNREDIYSFLKKNGVNYYITYALPKGKDGCYFAVEPSQPQPLSAAPRMTTNICAEPVFQTHFPVDSSNISTMVFEVR